MQNPLFITDDPTMHGKRFRLLDPTGRSVFLTHKPMDLQQLTYTQLLEWFANPSAGLPYGEEEEPAPDDEVDDGTDISGTFIFELHLQDYLHKKWTSVFPDLKLYQGDAGKEFITKEPAVGIIDFLCQDGKGNYVVIETKRNMADRKAVGQILGYMGWVQQRLCANGQSVSGLLIAGEASDTLRMAVSAVPNLKLMLYEVSFSLTLG